MNLYAIFLIAHLFGFAWGLGSATVSDVLFFRSIKDKVLSAYEFETLKTVSKVVIAGLSVAVLSGAGMLVMQYFNTGEWSLLANARFQAKVTLVGVVIANGVIFHSLVFPIMGKYVGLPLNNPEMRSKLWLFAVTGAVSVTSWYGVVILAFWRTLDMPYLLIINIYILLVLLGSVFGYFMLHRTIYSGTEKSLEESNQNDFDKPDDAFGKKENSVGRFSRKNKKVPLSILIILLVLIGTSFYLLEFRNTGEVHYACINEAPPWFRPDVLKINPGDTVVWEHCHEEEYHDYQSSHVFSHPVFLREISAHEGHSHDSLVHTHPILSTSGPETFSSGFRPIGHLADEEGFSHTFTEEGVYEYICPTHPYMKGVVAVGTSYEKDSLWPPEEVIKPEFLPPPGTPGIGEIWVNTQFEKVSGQTYPGTITVIDAETWEITDVISDENFNNPHNLWNSYREDYVFQTQWHSDGFSKIDTETKEVIETISLGNAPAHVFVHPHEDRIYVTLNNENRVAILDSNLNLLGNIETSFGAHGIWIDPSGRWMSVAATLEEKMDIIDLETEEVVATFDAPGLPLATQITNDGRYAMISLLLEGRVRFIDLEQMKHVADVEVGEMPIWAMPDPSGEFVFVPNTGSADISVISLETLEVVNTIPAAGGAHGIIFGPKEGGGYYGYFSNKFARVVGVIDLESQELVGHIELPETAWGGNGILVLPNIYEDFIIGQ